MKKKELDVVFLLDKSGSMYDCVSDTIGGYNNYINNLKGKGTNALIKTVLFNNEYQLLHERTPIQQINKLTNKEYFVNGSTALLDAIGNSIETIEKKVKNNKVLFVITTDGLENASIKYTKEQIKEMIVGHKNWEFIYIGANIDSFSESASIGISKKNTCNYKTNSSGIKNMFKAVECATSSIYNECELREDWKSSLKENWQ